jgi:hypothetical protein
MSMDINLCYSYEAYYIKNYSKTKCWHVTTIIKPQRMPCTHVYLSFFHKIIKHENKFHFGFESCDYKKMIEESRIMKLGANKIQGNSFENHMIPPQKKFKQYIFK